MTRPVIHDARPVTPTRGDAGMTTAEYAVGTVGATAMAAVLVRLVGDDTFLELVRPLLEIGVREVSWPDGWPSARPFRGIRP